MTNTDVRTGFQEHAALAQFYRWYQLYERPAGGIDNALDILAPDVTVTSGLGTATGHDEYAARIAQLPDTWRNAHHVKSTRIEHGDGGKMTLAANIVYQNQGMLPDGAVREADLTYTVDLVPTDGLLPLLSRVTIAQDSETSADTFVDAYAENRMRSLVHHWLAIIEDPARDPEPAREIFADEFSLNFSSGKITDFEGFATWLRGPGSQVAANTHSISNFFAKQIGEDTYEVSVEFDCVGILPSGDEMTAKTRHRWAVSNDVTERFARIKTVDVEVLEDFRLKAS